MIAEPGPGSTNSGILDLTLCESVAQKLRLPHPVLNPMQNSLGLNGWVVRSVR